MTLIFRVDPVQWVVPSRSAWSLPSWVVVRECLVVSASNVAVVWTILYAVLTVQQSDGCGMDDDVVLIALVRPRAAYHAAARAKLG